MAPDPGDGYLCRLSYSQGPLGGPHKLLGAHKDPPRGPSTSKMAKNEHKSKKNFKSITDSIIKVHFLADSTVM